MNNPLKQNTLPAAIARPYHKMGSRKVVDPSLVRKIMQQGQGSSNRSELSRSIRNPAIGSRRMSGAL